MPDSTMSGAFLRRFDEEKNEALTEVVMATTVSVLLDRLTSEGRRVITMEFATFRRQFTDIAVQTIRAAWRRVLKILGDTCR